jgi:hypothetical protein
MRDLSISAYIVKSHSIFDLKESAIIATAAIYRYQIAITIFYWQFEQMKENFIFSATAFSTNYV